MTYPSPERVLLIDIETASQHPGYAHLPPDEAGLWESKNAWHINEREGPDSLYERRAAILAEFGRIVCISAAYYKPMEQSSDFELRVKSFYGTDENAILTAFFEAVNALSNRLPKSMMLAGHNIREFDIPYLCRRALILKVPIPPLFDLQQQKPWEVTALDTLHLWRFGDYKHYTSLALLAHCFGIESPKTHMDGSMVSQAFWIAKNYEAIAGYCQGDVTTTATVLHHISSGAIPLASQTVLVKSDLFLLPEEVTAGELPDDFPAGTPH